MNGSNFNSIKPWFVEDHAKSLASTYFTITQQHSDREFRRGAVVTLAALAIQFGVNPESFLAPEDVQLIREQGRYTSAR